MRGGKAMGTRAGLVCVMGALLVSMAHAQLQNADDLARRLANPVAALISVPFQYNVDYHVGPDDGTRRSLTIQPVVPMSISSDWNVIVRVIAPVIHQNDVFGDSGSQFGLGDITPTLFLSPKAPIRGGLIWGAGPVFLLPTATDERLGGEKWGAGPSVVLLTQTAGGYTYGALVNHLWSVAGDDDRGDISRTFFQPFLAKAFPGGRTLTLNVESSYDWNDDEATVPINLMYSKVTRFGGQMVSLQGGVRVYADSPGGGPDWGLRFVVTLLYPR